MRTKRRPLLNAHFTFSRVKADIHLVHKDKLCMWSPRGNMPGTMKDIKMNKTGSTSEELVFWQSTQTPSGS